MMGFFRSIFSYFAKTPRRVEYTVPEELLQTRKPIGACGERIARWYLEEVAGMHFLEANARTHLHQNRIIEGAVTGEIDLVMEESDEETHSRILVFVEVRTREAYSRRYGAPVRSINYAKQRHICAAASFWLSEHGFRQRPHVRFDVVSIVWPKGMQPEICYIPDAFSWV